VGFIHKLPHNLVEAFHSTLEEAREADILLQVVDYSDPHYKEQIAVTNRTLQELKADGIPMIYVYNKADGCLMIPFRRARVQRRRAEGFRLSQRMAFICRQKSGRAWRS
jgi:50S ribosomal subunit-associated GTPase HflX